MTDTYAILGYANDLYGPVVLFESDSYESCNKWREQYTRFGDWGGYDCLALYEIAPSEQAFTIHKTDSPIMVYEKESN